jgi:hypothetical protein
MGWRFPAVFASASARASTLETFSKEQLVRCYEIIRSSNIWLRADTETNWLRIEIE